MRFHKKEYYFLVGVPIIHSSHTCLDPRSIPALNLSGITFLECPCTVTNIHYTPNDRLKYNAYRVCRQCQRYMVDGVSEASFISRDMLPKPQQGSDDIRRNHPCFAIEWAYFLHRQLPSRKFWADKCAYAYRWLETIYFLSWLFSYK